MSRVIVFILMLFSTSVISKEQKLNGVFQAYWLPIWSNGVNHPEIQYRFFNLEDERNKLKIINIDTDKDNNEMLERIKKDNPLFYNDKYGHVEYSGEIIVKGVKKIMSAE